MPYMNVPPTQKASSISDGYVRLSSVACETATSRNRYKPIYQPGQSRHVGGPNNAGDPETAQIAKGGGSFSTMGQGNSGSA